MGSNIVLIHIHARSHIAACIYFWSKNTNESIWIINMKRQQHIFDSLIYSCLKEKERRKEPYQKRQMSEETSSEHHEKSTLASGSRRKIWKKCNWHHGELKCFPFWKCCSSVFHKAIAASRQKAVNVSCICIYTFGAQQYTMKTGRYAVNMRECFGGLSRIWVWQEMDFNHFYFIPRF